MAFYDHKPSKVEAVGDGRYYYRWNIQEHKREAIFEGTEEVADERVEFECNEVIVDELNSNAIVEAVIASGWSPSREQKLVNDYNSAQLGLYGDKKSETAQEKIAAYTDFLNCRNELKAQVDADCLELGIK